MISVTTVIVPVSQSMIDPVANRTRLPIYVYALLQTTICLITSSQLACMVKEQEEMITFRAESN